MKNPIVWLFIMLGSFFLAIGIVFSVYNLPYNEIVSTFCFAAAVTFYTATIIERLLLREFTKSATERVEELFKKYSEKTQEAIRQQLNITSELLRNADYNGISGILPPRRDSKNGQGLLTLSRIRFSLENAKNVKIFCISGREFLWPRVVGGLGGFYDIFEKKAKSGDYNVKILLADKEGYGATLRGQKEDPQEPDYIKTDVERSCKEMEKMKRRLKQISPTWSVKICFYNFIPQAWFVITDDEIFLEPYHMADTDELRKCFPENFTDTDVCCGGRVPIIVAKRKTFLYESLSNYFDWLWIHNDPIIFGNKYRDLFNVECFDDIKTISKGRDEG